MSNGRLSERVAVVTGASRGIGRAIAEAYVAEGARVVCAARDSDALAEVVASITANGGQAIGVACDVTSDHQVAELKTRAEDEMGRVTILVNGVGAHKTGRFLDFEVDDFRELMEINFLSMVRTIKAFLPAMIEDGYGKIVNIASTAGKYGSLFQSPYNSSKHAVVGLTRCLALETAKQGITANAICPGFVETEMMERVAPQLGAILGVDDPEEVRQVLLSRVPIGRMLAPEEIAHLAVYLGSAESDGMTGQALTISGGLILV